MESRTCLTLVDSFVSFCHVLDEQPKVVGELKVHNVPLVSDEGVQANGQELKLLTLL